MKRQTWKPFHKAAFVLILLASFFFNTYGNDIGKPTFSPIWFPLAIAGEFADFTSNFSRAGLPEYSSVGYTQLLLLAQPYLGLRKLHVAGTPAADRPFSPGEATYLIRWINGLLGTLLIFLFVRLLSSEALPSERGRILLMAFLAAISPAFVFWNHSASFITLTLFWSVISAVFFVKYLSLGNLRHLAVMAACGAMAAGIKETSWGVVPLLAVAGPLMRGGFSRTLKSGSGLAGLAKSVAVCGFVSVAVLIPFYALHLPHDIHHFKFYLANQAFKVGPHTVFPKDFSDFLSLLARNVRQTLSMFHGSLGWGILPFILFSLIPLVSPGKKADAVTRGFPAPVLAYFFTYLLWFPILWRPIFPVDLAFPALILTPLAAGPLEELARWKPARAAPAGKILAAALLIGWTLSAASVLLVLKTDTRVQAEERLAARERVVSVGKFNDFGLVFDMNRFPDRIRFSILPQISTAAGEADTDYLVMNERQREFYETNFLAGGLKRHYEPEEVFRVPWGLSRRLRWVFMDNYVDPIWLYKRVRTETPASVDKIPPTDLNISANSSNS